MLVLRALSASILVLLTLVLFVNAAAAAAERPNIVVVMVDDMGFSDIGPYGSEIPTPHLDALAEGGVKFSHFYNTGRCCPTRASLLTGLYAHQAGMGLMTGDQGLPGYTGRLNDRCVTIAEVLGQAGYLTAMTGKWHVGFEHGVTPPSRGFDRSLNMPAGGLHFWDQTGSKGKTKVYLNGDEIARDDPRLNPPGTAPTCGPTTGWSSSTRRSPPRSRSSFTSRTSRRTSRAWRPRRRSRSTAASTWPAGTSSARSATPGRSRAALIDESWTLTPRPEEIPAWNSLPEARQRRYDDMMAIYAAMIEEIDRNMGKLVAALRQREVLDNTLILFLSDNGGNAEAGVPGRYKGDNPGDPHSNVFIGQCWAHLNNTPFRKYKHYSHEGGTATPLIAHWPDGIARSKDDEWIAAPTHVIDLMATCADLAEMEYPESFNGQPITPLEGQSLRPLLTGEGEFAERPLYWEHHGNAAVRVGDRKLVREGQGGEWELFDLAIDRTEQHNLAQESPDEAAGLQKQWTEWAQTAGVLPRPQKRKKN